MISQTGEDGKRAALPPAQRATSTNAVGNVSTLPQSQGDASLPFQVLGRYRVIRELGRGGMGAVYLAEDTVLKRQVALKIPQFDPSKAEQMEARFMREAQLAAQLSHPNICQVYDVGVIDGQYVMAMEYIDGRTLSAYTKPDKLLSERQAAALVKKVALAVEAAHKKNMIHRDLKPGNIMLAKPDADRKGVEPKVMDFGLAKSLDSQDKGLTKSGMILGTPCYMSKEQWSGKDGQIGPPSDVYSLGMILYELLTGKLPYEVHDDEPATAWFVNLVTKAQKLPREWKPSIDLALDSIVMRAIAMEPEDRFSSMTSFAAAVENWLQGHPVDASRYGSTVSDEMPESREDAVRNKSRSSATQPSMPKSKIRRRSNRSVSLAIGNKKPKAKFRVPYFWLGLMGTMSLSGIILWRFFPSSDSGPSPAESILANNSVTTIVPEPADLQKRAPNLTELASSDTPLSIEENPPRSPDERTEPSLPTPESASAVMSTKPATDLPRKLPTIAVIAPEFPESNPIAIICAEKKGGNPADELKLPRPVRYHSGVSVRYVFKLFDLADAIASSLGIPHEEALSLIEFSSIEIERKTVLPQGGHVFGPWEPLPLSDVCKILESSLAFDLEIVAATAVRSALAMPLPRLAAGRWTIKDAVHSRMADHVLTTSEQLVVDRIQAELYSEMVRKKIAVNLESLHIGFREFMIDQHELDTVLGTTSNSYAKTIDSVYAALVTEQTAKPQTDLAELLKSPEEFRNRISQKFEDVPHLLVRFMDFTCKRGSTYSYRVRIGIKNPIFGKPQNELVDPDTASQQTVVSEWSQPTPRAFVPSSYRYYVDRVNSEGGTGEYAMVAMYSEQEAAGTPTMSTFKVLPGMRIGGTSKVELVDLGNATLKPTDVEFRCDDLLASVTKAPRFSYIDSELDTLSKGVFLNNPLPDRITVIDANGAIVTRYAGDSVANGGMPRTKAVDEKFVLDIVKVYGHLRTGQMNQSVSNGGAGGLSPGSALSRTAK